MTDEHSESGRILKERLLYSIQSLCEIGEELSAMESFANSGQSVLHLIMGTLAISKAAVMLFDPETSQLEAMASRGVEDEHFILDLPDQVHNHLHKYPKPYLISDPGHHVLEDYFAKIEKELEDLHSHVWIPLRVKSRFLGIITVSKKFMGQDYEAVDLELLNIIAQQLSIAVNNFILIRDLKTSNFQLNHKLLELETLYDLGIAIGSIMEVEELAEKILFNSVGLTDASAGVLAFIEGDVLVPMTSINIENAEVCLIRDYPPAKQALEDEKPVLVNDPEEEMPCGFQKAIFVPIKGQRGVLGLLVLADKESRDGIRNFDERDERLLLNFATQAGVAIENARFYQESLEKERLEREMEVAATIQRNLLPDSLPDIPGLQIAATTIPSRAVGGDTYDFVCRGKDHLFAVADVSGKGIPAALLVSMLHATQLVLLEEKWNLPRIVSRLSDAIYKSSLSNKFITYFAAIFNEDNKTLTTVNAGHNYPMLFSASGSVTYLQSGGLVLGMMPDVAYSHEVTHFQPGDVLLMFTDGVSEAMDPSDEEFTEERLELLVKNNRHKTAQEIFDIVMHEVDEFCDTAPQYDDLTLVIIKMEE